MSSLCIISQASAVWSVYAFWVNHSFISIVIFLIILRYLLRWFFGITKIRQAQDRYTELLEEHTSLLQRQNELLEEHQSVLSRLGEKLL
jgi:hypothetical protein